MQHYTNVTLVLIFQKSLTYQLVWCNQNKRVWSMNVHTNPQHHKLLRWGGGCISYSLMVCWQAFSMVAALFLSSSRWMSSSGCHSSEGEHTVFTRCGKDEIRVMSNDLNFEGNHGLTFQMPPLKDDINTFQGFPSAHASLYTATTGIQRRMDIAMHQPRSNPQAGNCTFP